MSFSDPLNGYSDRDAQMGHNSPYKALQGVAPETRVKILAKIVELDANKVQFTAGVPIESYLSKFDQKEIDLFKNVYQQVLEERVLRLRQDGKLNL